MKHPLTLFLTVAVLSAARPAAAGTMISGADCSLVPFFEARGVVYRDQGMAEDPFQILKSHGITCVRLRLFTSSAAQAAADPYDYGNNLDYTVPLAVRVKAAGLKFLLDFHYSDTWADPGHQATPTAWTNLSFSQLVTQVRSYTSNSIATLQAAGAMPDYVQVGNEITGGMLWPNGAVGGANNNSNHWSQFRQLLNAAIQGTDDAAGGSPPKIMIHIDRGGDWNGTESFFDHLAQSPHPVAFDWIGESYYPIWHGSPGDLSNCLTNAARRYQKPVLVAETSFPWSGTTNIYGIPPNTNGQVQYVAVLAQVLAAVPGGLGAGAFWWGTEYQQVYGVSEAGVDLTSFFGSGAGSPTGQGGLLPVANAFGGLAAPLVLNATLSGGAFSVTWPLSGAGMTLTTATDLTAAGSWSPVANAVQSTGSVFSATMPFDGSAARFYRLQPD